MHWSKRIGKNNQVFLMPKFRTMKADTPNVATHLLVNPDQHITKVGSFLRKTSLDELPQIWSVIRGQMSVVGPRPALYNQHDLIDLRFQNGIHKIKPGITGLAQISGRDELSIKKKVALDLEYLEKQSCLFDLQILAATISMVFRRQGVIH